MKKLSFDKALWYTACYLFAAFCVLGVLHEHHDLRWLAVLAVIWAIEIPALYIFMHQSMPLFQRRGEKRERFPWRTLLVQWIASELIIVFIWVAIWSLGIKV